MLHGLTLGIHIASGTAGLILGPITMRAAKRRGRHTRAGEAYHWILLTVCVSATVLALLDWSQLWWFLPIAVGSYGFALLGYIAAKRRWDGWLLAHVAGQGGSYIALVTALLVVNLGGPLVIWFLPTIVGSPLIAWVSFQVASGKRPRYRPAGAVSAGRARRRARMPRLEIDPVGARPRAREDLTAGVGPDHLPTASGSEPGPAREEPGRIRA
jgi:hypothetical protein